LRHHKSHDGSGRIEIRGPLDRTAQMMVAIAPYERELFEEHRRDGRPEHPDATAFDAMFQLCTQTRRDRHHSRSRPSTHATTPLTMLIVHVSHQALARGHTQSGEICEIEGAGPVPVGVARRLQSDSILRAVVTDGVDVSVVAHLGRTIPAHLRTAVRSRDRECVISGCSVDRHLELDHNVPFAAGGPASLENLGSMCQHHHDVKSRRDLRRVGPLGAQRLVTKQAHAEGRAPPLLGAA
jgi:hypothetical protein